MKKIAILAIVFWRVAAWAELSEAQIFEWWDDGTITAEEANEMLDLLETGDEQEACLLAEAYDPGICDAEGVGSSSSEPDASGTRNTASPPNAPRRQRHTGKHPRQPAKESTTPDATKRQRPPAGGAPWRWAGSVRSRSRFDSTGHVVRHHEELRLLFYRFEFRLGTQELLTYRNGGNEASFGQIATQELHSFIPLDTLWGTSARVDLGKFHAGGALDTSMTAHALIGIKPAAGAALDLSVWRTRHHRSVELSATLPCGQIAGWLQEGSRSPLVKMELTGSDPINRQTRARSSLFFSWRTSVYFHGASVPDPARLSTSILSNRLWANQNVAARLPDRLNTRLSLATRLTRPLDSNDVLLRAKLQAETGPEKIRLLGNATCRDAHDGCSQSDWQARITSTHHPGDSKVTVGATVKSSATREEGFKPPQAEASIAFRDSGNSMAKLTFTVPKGNPSQEFHIRNEFRFTGTAFECTFAAIFKKKSESNIHPSQGALNVNFFF